MVLGLAGKSFSRSESSPPLPELGTDRFFAFKEEPDRVRSAPIRNLRVKKVVNEILGVNGHRHSGLIAKLAIGFRKVKYQQLDLTRIGHELHKVERRHRWHRSACVVIIVIVKMCSTKFGPRNIKLA
jgi:hypothetical protein